MARQFDCPATGGKCAEDSCTLPKSGVCLQAQREEIELRCYEAEKAEAQRLGRIRRKTVTLDDIL